MAKLTAAQQALIDEYRKQGIGYRTIATEIGVSRDAVRYYCKKVKLDGDLSQPQAYVKVLQCQQCGKLLSHNRDGRQRIFCSDQCRYRWWNTTGRTLPRPSGCCDEIKCACCGKTFQAYSNRKRRYCSHECYIRDRFWRKEDGREPYVPPKDR